MNIELGALIAIVGTAAGVWFGYMSKQKISADAIRKDAEGHTELKTDVAYIRRGIDDIKLDFKAQERRVSELSDRVIRVEECTRRFEKILDAKE